MANKKVKEPKVEKAEKSDKKKKVECPCGSIVTKQNLSKHKKSQKHQNWEKNQTE